MKKKILTVGFVIAAIMLIIAPTVCDARYGYYSYVGLGCVIGLAIAAFGGAIGQAISVNSALNGIARNPGAAGKITTGLLIGLALIESLVIYTLVIALILLFVKPYGM